MIAIRHALGFVVAAIGLFFLLPSYALSAAADGLATLSQRLMK